MDIQITENKELVITGNIKSVKDYQLIKNTVNDLISSGAKEITIVTPALFSITSSVIGFFMKVIFQDNIKLTLHIADERLYSLLKDLKLTETFNVVKSFNIT